MSTFMYILQILCFVLCLYKKEYMGDGIEPMNIQIIRGGPTPWKFHEINIGQYGSATISHFIDFHHLEGC